MGEDRRHKRETFDETIQYKKNLFISHTTQYHIVNIFPPLVSMVCCFFLFVDWYDVWWKKKNYTNVANALIRGNIFCRGSYVSHSCRMLLICRDVWHSVGDVWYHLLFPLHSQWIKSNFAVNVIRHYIMIQNTYVSFIQNHWWENARSTSACLLIFHPPNIPRKQQILREMMMW